MSAESCCDECLRRAWLLARLAGRLELERRRRRPLREILALADEVLIDALGGHDREALARAHARIVPRRLRDVAAAAALAAVCRHDARYPQRLRDLVDAPAALFVAGGLDRLAQLAGGGIQDGPVAIAVVGSRRASADGLEAARALGRGLAAAGVTVVSGMALGVDGAAHRGALDVGGPSIAVLASGADVAYPRSMSRVHADLRERGCVISEMPPGFSPLRWCFPARNRIIAALARMTVVVEAAERSGSLITAEVAADLGREVAAVPGPVASSRTRGSNALLRDGATVVRDAADALDSALGPGAWQLELEPTSELPRRLAGLLAKIADGCDTVAALAADGRDVPSVLAALSELELLGRVRRVAGGRYVVAGR